MSGTEYSSSSHSISAIDFSKVNAVHTIGCGNTKKLRCPFLLDEMQPRAVLFLHLFSRNNSAAKVCELQELMLDCL